MSDFIHLHNHTHYSLQDGACTVDGLIDAAKKFNMPAVALTDHGVLYGIPEFYKKAKKSGIKPIIGMEAYITLEGTRFERERLDVGADGDKKKSYNHLILLAKNFKGYKNLIKLSSLGFLEGFYYKPRIDMELLKKYSEGLICTSACIGGVINTHLINNNYKRAKEIAIQFKEIFDKDFYLEIQNHGFEKDEIVMRDVPKLAQELNLEILATNDCHYINQEDAIAHNILLLMSDKNNTPYNQLRYKTDQIYFKSQEEMKALFKKLPKAIENTIAITEKINLELKTDEMYFPEFPIPEESNAKTLNEYLRQLTDEGTKKRFTNISSEIKDRIDFELATINSMGFAGYFLIVQDFINAAKRSQIPVGPGRGSVAGSLVAYVLGITEIDPLRYDLLFERFLNPERKSMPDIDVDFADDQRAEVIDYVKKKYGSKSVSQIITFNRLSSKQVLRDVARVLQIPIPVVNNITKFIPSKFGKVATIDEALKDVPELKQVRNSKDEQIVNLIKYAKVLEGMNRNMSKHAAGVVITPGEASNYVPLATAQSQEEIVTQYNMKELEDAGLLKMDFLGLSTLTVIKDTIKLVKKNHNVEIDIQELQLDDQKTFETFSKGQTTGVFQFESPPMREYLKKLKPNSIKDLAAMNALYRPGPMDFINDFIDRKFGRKKIVNQHPIVEPILRETYGIIVYQEQVIQIANKVAGMTLAQADLLRRAMGKKDERAMNEQKEIFVNGAVANNLSQKAAVEIFETIHKFANYGFNKSHSVAYALIAYQTAYLKTHYPAEFLAANLKSEFNDKTKVAKFLDECRKLKIEIVPPDINYPSVFFDVYKGKISFGLSAIKNVGVNAVEEIIKKRNDLKRKFKSIYDFCSNTDTRLVNKRVLEGLTLAGAFDSINKNRHELFESVEDALNFGSSVSEFKMRSTTSLFGEASEETFPEPIPKKIEPWSYRENLAKEREVIGFYVSDHPLKKYELEYRSFANIHLGEAEELGDKVSVHACGMITNLTTKMDRSSRMMAFFTLDDFSGSGECLMFAGSYEKYKEYIFEESAVLIEAKTESSGDAVKLHVEAVIPLDKARERYTKFVKIITDAEKVDVNTIAHLRKLFEKYSGNFPVLIELLNNGGESRIFKSEKFLIEPSDNFIAEITSVLGEESVSLISK